jgi:HlyD family secretion protein
MKRTIIIIVVITAVVAGIILWQQYNSEKEIEAAQAGMQTEVLQKGTLISTIGATGTVRSKQTANLDWKTSGTVEKVLANVGDEVKSGQILASLEQTSLPQNVILARVDLVTAQKTLDDLLNSDLQQAKAMQALEAAQQALDDLNNPELQQATALQAIADAAKAVEYAQTAYLSLQGTASDSDIDKAKAEMTIAEADLNKAKDNYAPYADKPESNLDRANFLSALAAAQQKYDYAVRNYNYLISSASETDLAVAEANVATAKAQQQEAERQYERIKDGPNPADVSLLEAQLADAQREWDRIKNGADPDDVSVAESRISAAQATLAQADINAPFDGVLTVREVTVGDQVIQGTPAFRIDDMSSLLVDLEVTEVDINQIHEGQEVSLTFDAIEGKEYYGEIIEVGLVGNPEEGIVNFTVTIELSNADAAVKPGMTSAVNIIVGELEDVLMVPNRAVRVVDKQHVVYVVTDNGNLKMVEIVLGASSDVYSEVIEGELEVGDVILLNPSVSIFDQGIEMAPGSGGPLTRGGGIP